MPSVYAYMNIHFQQLTTANGLADNSVRHIFQDSKGFLWMATMNGLSRYDGNSFVNLLPQNGKGVMLTDHRIRSLVEDKNGFLWISTYDDKFNCYSPQNNSFIDFIGLGADTTRYENIFVANDAVWLWGKMNGCIRVDNAHGEFISETFNAVNKKLPTNNVRFVMQGGNDIYVGTDKGLYLWESSELKCICPDVSFMQYISYEDFIAFISYNGQIWLRKTRKSVQKVGEPDSLSDVFTGVLAIGNKCIILTKKESYGINIKNFSREKVPDKLNVPGGVVIKDNKGNYWIQNNTGVLRYVNVASNFIKEFHLGDSSRKSTYREQYHILQDSRGNIWITTYGNGLFVYAPSTDEVNHYEAHRNNVSSIGSNYLHYIMEDDNGGIWISSEFNGVSHLNIFNENIQRIFPEDIVNTSLNTIRMASRTKDGFIWLGTRSGNLYRYDSNLTSSSQELFSDIHAYDIIEDEKGQRWIGTRGRGLSINGKYYTSLLNDSTSLANNNIFAILQDSKQRIWIGTFGGGLNMAVNKKDGYSFKRFKGKEYGQRWVRCLSEDKNGWIWAGTSGGIFIFQPDEFIKDTQSYISYNMTNGKLKSNEIRAIFSDSQGRIWIAETGRGFCMATLDENDYQNLCFKHYDTSDGLVNNKVVSFTEDTQGMIWISTEYGLSCFNPGKEIFENYFFSDFMLDDVYIDNCSLTLPDGRVAFGTCQGLLLFDPEKIRKDHVDRTVTFTNLKLNGLSVQPNDPDSPLQVALPYNTNIELKHNQNTFIIEFSTLTYTDANACKYSYYLENYDEAWSIPSSLNFAAYKNLPPNTYFLHVKACDASGHWSQKETILEIVVLPPFWRTASAYSLYFIAVSIFCYMVFRNIKKINILRNRIQVEKQLSEYKQVFFTNISHEFRTPLTLIQGSLERIENIGGFPADASRSLQTMARSTQRLLRLVNQLLEFRKMQSGKLVLALEQTDAIAFLHEIFRSFTDVAERKRMDYRFVSDVKSFSLYLDKEKIDKVAYNLLSNAFKYTPIGGSITLVVEVDGAKGCFCFSVVDTGIGISPEKQKDLFTRFMQNSFPGDSIGVGLNLSYGLVQIHHGTLTYKAHSKGGSVFKVCLPIARSVYNPKEFLAAESQQFETSLGGMSKSSVLTDAPVDIRLEVPVNKKKVLIIEDEDDIRNMLCEEIGRYFEADTAPDGIVGLEKARTNDFDLIICDVMMPGLDGFKVTRRLKSDFATCHIPIVLLTALSSADKQLKGIDAGADAYISKPFSIRYLLTRILRMMEQRERLREKFSKEPGVVHETIFSTVRDKVFADRLACFLEANMSRPELSVKDLSREFGMGQTAFFQKVKGITGYAPVEYIRVLRLKKAAELLLSADERTTIAEIAYKVGFNDALYFSRCFRAQFGKAPTQYQKEYLR